MIVDKERTYIENQIISGLLISEQFFLKLYDFNPNTDDLFLNQNNRSLYFEITDYYVEKGYPTAPDVFNHLILKQSGEDLKNHFLSGPAKAEPILDFNIILKLIEDAIEKKTRGIITNADKKKLFGLEYAETIREDIDRVLLEKFNCYKKDNRTNEQKVYEVVKTIQQTRQGKATDYLPTGFNELDKAIIGLPKSHLTTIASRPGMGKTSFMLKLKRNLVQQGYKPLIISIEMSSEQLLIKDISAYSKIDSRKIESGSINEIENDLISKAAKHLYDENYFLEDDSSWTIEKIKATIRKYLFSKHIDIVFIDYLTLIRTNTRRDRFDLAVGEMTNSLREFAKETKLPIVILSQLNRDCEKRIDKKPILSDLKESGSIEQDSKTVLFLFRPGYYGIDEAKTHSKMITKNGVSISNDEFAEVIIAKARSGKTGIIPVRYQKEIHEFEDMLPCESDGQFSYSQKSIKSYYENDVD